jgi:integrase
VVEHHPEGQYFLRYAVGGKWRWEKVGKDPFTALDSLRKREHSLALGIGLPELTQAVAKVTLTDSVTRYLENCARLKKRSRSGYTCSLNLFLSSTQARHVDEIIKQDLIDFETRMLKMGYEDRTVDNRLGHVVTFLRSHDVKDVSHHRKYTEKIVKAYRADELKKLFAAANGDEHLLFFFFLCTGAREQEAQFACWSDVDFEDSVFTVKQKIDLGFSPKDYEEREIPIPDSLVTALRERRRLYADTRLIFSGKNGKPEGHFLRILKRLAMRAGLNCGNCVNKVGLSCATHSGLRPD